MDANFAAPTWGSTSDSMGSWFFEATPSDPASGKAPEGSRSRARWLTDTLERLLSILSAHSRFQRAEVATASVGDDAFRADFSRAGSVDDLMRYLESCLDFAELSLAISPRCMDLSGQAFELPFGLELRIDAPANASFERPFSFALFANTTIYAEATWDGNGDNRAWARANQPSLRNLLERFETSGLRFSGCESPFTDEIRRTGFCNLREEFRAYHVKDGDRVTRVVERRTDGVEVVIADRFELLGTTLFIEYELAAPGTETAARIMLLEHLVPELAPLRAYESATKIHFKNRKSRHEASIAWPTKPSPPPKLRMR